MKNAKHMLTLHSGTKEIKKMNVDERRPCWIRMHAETRDFISILQGEKVVEVSREDSFVGMRRYFFDDLKIGESFDEWSFQSENTNKVVIPEHPKTLLRLKGTVTSHIAPRRHNSQLSTGDETGRELFIDAAQLNGNLRRLRSLTCLTCLNWSS